MARSFSALPPLDFEAVCADLLGAELGLNFERFAAGRDDGIDLRAFEPGVDHPHIVQCRHYERSGFQALLRSLRPEVARIDALRPATYRVATSVDLSKTQKDQIYELFEAHMPNESFVLGAGDLDGLLTKHDRVELRHPQLWFASGSVLESMLAKSHLERSRHLAEQISEALPRYVESSAYPIAMTKLQEHGVCVLSGAPGVGKTTLAHVLAARLAIDGFEIYEISHDVEAAWQLLDSNRKQLFIFDDFLGRVSEGEHLSNRSDYRIAALIHKISLSPNSRLILTTREYIWASAIRTSIPLSRVETSLKFVVEISHYSRMQRARILYNHLWHSDLPDQMISAMRAGRQYLRVIDHPNFSPRLIEFLTSPRILPSVHDYQDDYIRAAVSALDSPEEIWRLAFESHLTEQAKAVLVALLAQRRELTTEELERCWICFCDAVGTPRHVGDYRNSLRDLEGSFLTISRRGGERRSVGFHDPSVLDFLLGYLADDLTVLEGLARSMQSIDELLRLESFGSDDPIDVLRNKRLPHVENFRRGVHRSGPTFAESVVKLFPETVDSESSFERELARILRLPGQLLPDQVWISRQLEVFARRLEANMTKLDDSYELLNAASRCSSARLGQAETLADSLIERSLRFKISDPDWLTLARLSSHFGLKVPLIGGLLIEYIQALVDDFDEEDPSAYPEFDSLSLALEELDLYEHPVASDLHQAETRANEYRESIYEPEYDPDDYRDRWEDERPDVTVDLDDLDAQIDMIFRDGL